MKVLLMCANGLSTGILMQKMKQWAVKNSQDLEIKAVPVDECANYYKDYDVMLIGPQMRYKLNEVKSIAVGKPAAVINPSDYALGNVDNIMKEIKKMMGEK